MKKFFGILLFLVVWPSHAVTTDVRLAEEARKILWTLKPVGRGKESQCRTVATKFRKVGNKTEVESPEKKICKEVEFDNVILAIKQPLRPFKLLRARMDTCTSFDSM